MIDKQTVRDIRGIARWVILGLSIVGAALYLNSAVFSWWASWGPPAKFPEYLRQRALIRLCLSGAILCGGVGLSWFVQTFPKLARVTVIWCALALLLLAIPPLREFLISDGCYDQGGRWLSDEFRCDR